MQRRRVFAVTMYFIRILSNSSFFDALPRPRRVHPVRRVKASYSTCSSAVSGLEAGFTGPAGQAWPTPQGPKCTLGIAQLLEKSTTYRLHTAPLVGRRQRRHGGMVLTHIHPMQLGIFYGVVHGESTELHYMGSQPLFHVRLSPLGRRLALRSPPAGLFFFRFGSHCSRFS